MLISLLLIGLLIYMLFTKEQTGVVSQTLQSLDAIVIAKKRLAGGEITIAEFKLIKKVIQK
jgi:uncharacterized membrane protein